MLSFGSSSHWDNFFSRGSNKNFKFQVKDKEGTKTDMLNNMQYYFSRHLQRQVPGNYYNVHSVIPQDDEDRVKYTKILNQAAESKQKFDPKVLGLSIDENRAIGCMVGLAIGDALGASTEFEPYNKHRDYWIQNSFADLRKCIDKRILHERHGEFAIWTDDCSMAIAMADSLMLNNYEFNPAHTRFMFHMWLEHGLGNGGRSHSIGLGGNISISMGQFRDEQVPYTTPGNRFNSGNGSLMRLAPVPICFRKDLEKGIDNSCKSSQTTHNGIEAAECCRLLSSLLINLMNRKEDEQWREVLNKTCQNFKSPCPNVQYLAQSKQETQAMFQQNIKYFGRRFQHQNKSLSDRNWNWRDEGYTYSAHRARKQPGYIGSYCMDALSMALHTIWFKNSLKDSILWAVNMGGDCDTVGAIVGQLAGAIYGFNAQAFSLYSEMQDFTKQRMEVFLVGLKLALRKKVNLELTKDLDFSLTEAEEKERQEELRRKQERKEYMRKLDEKWKSSLSNETPKAIALTDNQKEQASSKDSEKASSTTSQDN